MINLTIKITQIMLNLCLVKLKIKWAEKIKN